MENQRIVEFLANVERLGLRFPVATIARETGYSKGMVSRLLKGEEEPSEYFIDKFNKAFMKERIIMEDDAKLKEASASLGFHISDKDSIDAFLKVLKQQADTISSQANTIYSQQETIKLLTMKLP